MTKTNTPSHKTVRSFQKYKSVLKLLQRQKLPDPGKLATKILNAYVYNEIDVVGLAPLVKANLIAIDESGYHIEIKNKTLFGMLQEQQGLIKLPASRVSRKKLAGWSEPQTQQFDAFRVWLKRQGFQNPSRVAEFLIDKFGPDFFEKVDTRQSLDRVQIFTKELVAYNIAQQGQFNMFINSLKNHGLVRSHGREKIKKGDRVVERGLEKLSAGPRLEKRLYKFYFADELKTQKTLSNQKDRDYQKRIAELEDELEKTKNKCDDYKEKAYRFVKENADLKKRVDSMLDDHEYLQNQLKDRDAKIEDLKQKQEEQNSFFASSDGYLDSYDDVVRMLKQEREKNAELEQQILDLEICLESKSGDTIAYVVTQEKRKIQKLQDENQQLQKQLNKIRESVPGFNHYCKGV